MTYTPFLPFTCDTGDTINIGSTKWTCVVPCEVIGATIDKSLPVLTGPKNNTDELVLANSLRTKGKPGQVKIEVMTLGAYYRIDPIGLVGRSIIKVRDTCYDLVIFCHDGAYVKQKVDYDCEDSCLANDDLHMADLHEVGLLTNETWTEYQAQMEAVKADKMARDGRMQLNAAIRNLGINRVKEIIESKGTNA